jgi:hypothetical protein
MYAKMLGTCVLTVTAAAKPKVTKKPRVTKVADLALPEVGNPSLSKPEARNIIPMNMVKRVTACIPSMKVLAMPEREIPTPTIPIEVRPIPGVIRSQSVMLLYGTGTYFVYLIVSSCFQNILLGAFVYYACHSQHATAGKLH